MKPAKSLSRHRPAVHGGPGPSPAARRAIDFSSSACPTGPPKAVLSGIHDAAKEISIYPDRTHHSMTKCLAKYAGVPASSIIPGSGATEIIYRFCSVILGAGRRACIVSPAFAEYEAASSLAGCRISYCDAPIMADHIEKIIRAIPRGGCLFACSPNNPTGELLAPHTVSYIAKAAAKRHSILFLDESFIEMCPKPVQSAARQAAKSKSLFVLRSLTKPFGMPGIRAGYAVCHPNMAAILRQTSMPWNISVIAQKAACAAVESSRLHLQALRSLIRSEVEYLHKEIPKIPGYECPRDTAANYMLVKTRLHSSTVQKRLLKHNILVRNCSSFRGMGDNYIRIAIRTRRENIKLVAALRAI